MKSFLQILLVTLFVFQFPVDGEAQILRRTLGKLGERVVEKKVEKEVDKKIDEVADSIVHALDGEEPMTEEERREAQENRRRAGELMKGMMGGINQVELPENYQFDHAISMELEDHKGKVTPMTYYFRENSSVIGYDVESEEMKKGEKQFIVMDMEQEYMATFTESDGQKVAMSMPLPMNMLSSMASKEMEKQEEDFTFNKTGNTRTINGYHCTEYVVTTDDMIQHLWMTKDVDFKFTFSEIFGQMMKNQQQRFENPLVDEGYPILIEMIETKNKNRKSYMRTKEIKEGSFPFQASEYSYAY